MDARSNGTKAILLEAWHVNVAAVLSTFRTPWYVPARDRALRIVRDVPEKFDGILMPTMDVPCRSTAFERVAPARIIAIVSNRNSPWNSALMLIFYSC